MNSYQKAADALKEAVKASLDQDVDSNLQSEIWRHYQGMQSIANQLAKVKSEKKSKLDAFDYFYDPDYNIQAAQPVDYYSLGYNEGKDVITFS